MAPIFSNQVPAVEELAARYRAAHLEAYAAHDAVIEAEAVASNARRRASAASTELSSAQRDLLEAIAATSA